MTDEVIRPRTKAERRAYLSGWCNALLLANKEGIITAAKEARLMIELEEDFDIKKTGGVKYDRH